MSGNSTNATAAGGPGMSKEEKAILMPIYIICLLVALTGNALIIVVFYKYKPIRRSINFFVLNMAISDVFTPLTIMPYVIANILSNNTSLSQLPLPLAVTICKLCFFLADTSVIVSVLSLLMISLDRLIAVVFPLHIKLISRKVRFICMLASWVVAISVNGLYLRVFDFKDDGGCFLDFDTESWTRYSIATFIAFYLIPVCLLTLIYCAIAVTLKRRQRKVKKMSKSKRSNDHMHRSNRRVIGLSLAILAGFIICIGPLVVCHLIRIFLKRTAPPGFEKYPALEFIINNLLFHSWSAFNPCICFAFSGNYRSGFMHIFFGRSRAGSLSLSANTKTSVTRKRTRSSSSDHFSMKAFEGSENGRLKCAEGENKQNVMTSKNRDIRPQKNGRATSLKYIVDIELKD
ncbi:QRFP-like peptide receptor isoform X1 [Acropora muricata]|uniref:QRFP-like peptide receptor isoform X1 n=1 Tax=Acropora muricata TaxID=159855 RepID=UPI0034E455D9